MSDSDPAISIPNYPDFVHNSSGVSTAGAITLKISHGYTVSETETDPFVTLAGKTVE